MGRGRAPCCDKTKVKTGPWSPAEDLRLMDFIQKYGHTNWRALPKQAGLSRCGKSCRLRWINYLRPDVKRGNFTPQEENTIIQLHHSFGNKWSKIASCLPGRTDNEIKNVWNTHLKKKLKKSSGDHEKPVLDKGGDHPNKPNEKPDYSPSSSSCVLSNSSSPHGSPKQEAAASDVPTTSDFDVDFWQVLESLDPLQPTKTPDQLEIEENLDQEVEISKWLRVLENELGLVDDNDNDGHDRVHVHVQEPEITTAFVDFSAHHYLGI